MRLLNRPLCLALALAISSPLNITGWGASQKSRPGRGKTSVHNSPPSEIEKLRAQVTGFLGAWLVAHDVKKSLLFFSTQAFSNETMLQADCGGYIKDEQRQDQQAIQSGVERFLRDFAVGAKGRSLREQLNISRLAQPGSLKGLNELKQDKYLLVKLGADDLGQLIDNPRVVDRLRSKLKSENFYFSLIAVKESVFYFLWEQDAGQWRIYHADLICI